MESSNTRIQEEYRLASYPAPGSGPQIVPLPSSSSLPVDNTKTSYYYSTVSETPANNPPPVPRKKALLGFIGYKRGLMGYVIGVAITLLFNIIWLIWARVKHGVDSDGNGTIDRGDCGAMEKLDSDMHVVINVLSTIVLSASATFMGLAYSPSRKEVDAAHAKRKCLSVGALGFRNLWLISWKKGMMYLGLMLTSAPLHLLANTAIFTTHSANGYRWAVVNEGFVRPDGRNASVPINASTALTPSDLDSFRQIQSSLGSYANLTNQQCVEAYTDVYQSQRRTVLIVTPTPSNLTNNNNNNTAHILEHDVSRAGTGANNWICSLHQSSPLPGVFDNPCDTTAKSHISLPGVDKFDRDWKVFGHPVLYCLAEEHKPPCAVQYAPVIVGMLILVTALKLMAMIVLLLWYFDGEDRPLACPGDAAAEFLRREDASTIGMGTATRRNVKKLWKRKIQQPVWADKMGRAWRGASLHKWLYFVLSVLMMAFFALIYILSTVLQARESGREYHFFSHFGQPNPDFQPLSPRALPIVELSALANSPQFVLAFFWVIYAGLFGAMAHAQDWACFAKDAQSQTLMVSSPRGKQRGLWLLGVPFWLGVLLFLLEALTHFLVSRSIFPVRVQGFDHEGNVDPQSVVSTITTSPVAMLCLFFVTLLLLYLVTKTGRTVLPSAVPVAATCSAAISAACHPVVRREGMEYSVLSGGW